MALMKWESKYSVGVATIDGQHKGLFDILNELHAAMMQGKAQNVTGPLLTKLLEYTQSHFKAEEALMSAAHYPALAQHRQVHLGLTGQVQEFMARNQKGDSTVSLQLLTFLREWLSTHILNEDLKYAPALKGQRV